MSAIHKTGIKDSLRVEKTFLIQSYAFRFVFFAALLRKCTIVRSTFSTSADSRFLV